MSVSKKIVNSLTKAIREGATLKDVLLSRDLSSSILYEAEELMNFIFPPEEMKKPNPELPNLDEIIKLSLEPGSEQLEKNNLYQINRNASNFLSSPSKKIHEKLRQDNSKRFFKSLRKFIFSEYNQNIMFAGHFQRIFEATIQKSKDDLLDKSYNDNFDDNFIPFIVKNSHLLPYRELLTSIISEFSDSFPTAADEALRYAAISTLHFSDTPEDLNNIIKNPTDKKKADSLETQMHTSLEKLIADQPINSKHEKIPIPYYMTSEIEIKSTEIPFDLEFINKLKSDLKFDDLQYSDLLHSSKESDATKIDNKKWISFALNIIYAVKNAYESSTDNFLQNKVDQDLKEKTESNIIRCLLVCGMYADSFSSLSYTSFNLLFNLLNKQHEDIDGMIDDKYILNLKPPSIVKTYADHFVFDQYNISEKMISALLIFWNHSYKDPRSKKEKVEKKIPFPQYKPSKGVTPLRLLLPAILTEPIFSSKLNNIFMRIISSMEQEIIDTINEDMKAKTDQERKDLEAKKRKCFKLDSIWYELLTYKFKLLPNDSEEITLQKALEKLLALPTTDDFYKKLINPNDPNIKYYRAPTNPVIFLLSRSINHGPFFSYGNGINFRKFLTDQFSLEWVEQTITYCHIIDRMEKQLINTPYEKSKKKKLIVDRYASDDEMDLQAEYANKLTKSGKFKSQPDK